jgi:hypothetical protein
MESKNYKIKKNFISNQEVDLIIEWLNTLNHTGNDSNHHLTELGKSLNGKSYIFDISKTDETKKITKFHSITDVSTDDLPDFIYNIFDRISTEFNLPKDNIYLQAVDMNKGGKINPHYDAGIDGYINFKCNISVKSEPYKFYLDKEILDIEERDIYCFEASLYKHWTDEFNSQRIFLSFGIIIPYETLNRDKNDPRVRLSKRITKYFLNKDK